MNADMVARRLSALVGLVACLVWCGGCGSAAAPSGSVSGMVTYNGQPLTVGMVLFWNEETGVRAGAELDSSGNYQIHSIRTGDYQVALGHPPPPPPSKLKKAARGSIPRIRVPDKFLSFQTAGLSAKVERGENKADFSF